jgi:hypothetical protein
MMAISPYMVTVKNIAVWIKPDGNYSDEKEYVNLIYLLGSQITSYNAGSSLC